MKDRVSLRNILGSVNMMDGSSDPDNLAIALASYFSRHLDRPSDDPDDDELGWGHWVIEKTNLTLDEIVRVAFDAIFVEGRGILP